MCFVKKRDVSFNLKKCFCEVKTNYEYNSLNENNYFLNNVMSIAIDKSINFPIKSVTVYLENKPRFL